MAADISESGGHDCKGEPRGNTKLDADYPLRVLYCGVCSLPTEYCEYMPDVAKCRQWLEKNFPNEFAKLTVENSPKQESGISEGQGTAGEEEEKKKQKRGGRGQIKQKKKTTTKGYDSQNSQSKEEICNESMWPCNFWLGWQRVAKWLVPSGNDMTGEDEIIIQGDFTDDIIDVIQEKWPEVDDDSIEDLGEVKK
ncbi:density-regulated protein [Lynx pardinus]|uniref:Density-regulated protein n=1 Tax=Lynx pardinus TaxID=191816 RepID=A0A485MRM7_LYNPA|nr:density-regulated protein [Lynx pardinus]